MGSIPTIWIVVLNWNGLSDTLACLRSLRELRYPGRRVVVVDNGSTDRSVEGLRTEASALEFDLVECDRNRGYAGGNNVGIQYALDRKADFVLVLNNDTIVASSLLDELIVAAEKHPDVGCFGPWIYYMHDRERLWFTRSEWSKADAAFTAPGKGKLGSEVSQEPASTEYVCGAALFFRAEVARTIGLFDETFFLVYEDSDWGYRARRAGFPCMTVPSAHLWHKVGTSFGTEASPLRTYFSIRNKLLWARKNLPRGESLAVLRGAARRILPTVTIEWGNGNPAHKALIWAARGFFREASRKLHDPQEVAYRRGVVDYLLGRFGDCPPLIRESARAWAEARTPAAAPRSSAG